MAVPKTNAPLIRMDALECRAVDGQTNQFEIAFSSETPCERWGTVEVLAHDKAAVDLDRLSSTGTLLFCHGRDPNYGRVPIGKIVRSWLDETDRKCRAIIELDDQDESCIRLKSKLDRGMLNGVSVGYSVGAWTELKVGQQSADGRFTGPMAIASLWTPHEISLEPIPADPTVGLGKSMENEEDIEMAETATRQNEGTASGVANAVPAAPAPAAQIEREMENVLPTMNGGTDPLTEERARVVEITSICRSFSMDPDPFILRGDSLDHVRAAVLEKLKPSREPLRTGVGGGVSVVEDEMDKVRAAATDGLLLRGGVTLENPAPGALEFRGMSLQAIATECLTRSGEVNAVRLGKDELFRRAMTPDGAFAAISSNVANRTVLSTHQHAPTTFQYWTSKASVPDFRATDIYEISESGELDEITQNAEFKQGRLSDSLVATRRLLTFGKAITFTRQMFINDDIEMVTRTLTAYTLAFARGINKAVYALLRYNPAMLDGHQLFSAAHGNLSVGARPGTEAFADARRLMRKQMDLGGKVRMNISPAYVLTSAADETSVEMLLASLADPSANHSGVANVFRNRMHPIVDAELDVDSGPQPYFFASDPRLAETIEVCYLNGAESPSVETQQDFDHLGIRFRVYGDRGVTLLGYKGLVKNPGQV